MSSSLPEVMVGLFTTILNVSRRIPGLSFVIHYIESSYQNDPYRVALEVALFAWMLYYILQHRQSGKGEKLTEKEIESLIAEWEPEPLVPPTDTKGLAEDLTNTDAIISSCDNTVTMRTGEVLKNFSITNFLNLQNQPAVTTAAINAVRKYGVGACGPAGFYGSMDIHLELESKLARLFNVESAIIYSQGFMAVASVIPAFCKRGDIIVADDGCSYAIQTGLEISRSKVYYFKHNDLADLRKTLQAVDEECLRRKWPLSRRFMVVEGLYAKSGDLCPLSDILDIKKEWRYRLIVDESLSIGSIGPRGMGITDYFSIPPSEVELIVGSFSNSLGSSGGFCAGSYAAIDHQRLSSQAYCFSAALPPLLAAATLEAMKKLANDSSKEISKLKGNLECFEREFVQRVPEEFEVLGDPQSPLRHLRLRTDQSDITMEINRLKKIVSTMRKEGYLLGLERYSNREKFPTRPSIKLCLSSGFTKREISQFAQTLLGACN